MEQRHFPAQCRSQPDRRQLSDHQFPSEVLVTCTFSTLEIWSSCFDHEKAEKILETGYTCNILYRLPVVNDDHSQE